MCKYDKTHHFPWPRERERETDRGGREGRRVRGRGEVKSKEGRQGGRKPNSDVVLWPVLDNTLRVQSLAHPHASL